MVNTSTVDTDENYSMRYKVSDVRKTFKNILYYFTLAHKSLCVYILQIGPLNSGLIILSYCCVLSDLIRRISNYMCYILFICKGATNFRKYKLVSIQSDPKKTCADMKLSN